MKWAASPQCVSAPLGSLLVHSGTGLLIPCTVTAHQSGGNPGEEDGKVLVNTEYNSRSADIIKESEDGRPVVDTD
jgi:hypothetical protein